MLTLAAKHSGYSLEVASSAPGPTDLPTLSAIFVDELIFITH